MILSADSPDFIVVSSLVLTLVLFIVALVLSKKVSGGTVLSNFFSTFDAPPVSFDPSKAGASNLTLAATIIATILNAKVLPKDTRFLLPAEAYTYLQIFFGALLLLALVIYVCGFKRLGPYILADSLVFWAAFGSIGTLLELLRELP